MEESKLENKDVFFSFRVSIPKTMKESIFNSIVIGLSNFNNLKDLESDDEERKIRELNKILLTIQNEIDQLIEEV